MIVDGAGRQELNERLEILKHKSKIKTCLNMIERKCKSVWLNLGVAVIQVGAATEAE